MNKLNLILNFAVCNPTRPIGSAKEALMGSLLIGSFLMVILTVVLSDQMPGNIFIPLLVSSMGMLTCTACCIVAPNCGTERAVIRIPGVRALTGHASMDTLTNEEKKTINNEAQARGILIKETDSIHKIQQEFSQALKISPDDLGRSLVNTLKHLSNEKVFPVDGQPPFKIILEYAIPRTFNYKLAESQPEFRQHFAADKHKEDQEKRGKSLAKTLATLHKNGVFRCQGGNPAFQHIIDYYDAVVSDDKPKKAI